MKESHTAPWSLFQKHGFLNLDTSQLLGWLKEQTLQATGNDNILDLYIYSNIYHNQSDRCWNDNDFSNLLITFAKVCIYWTFSIPRGTCLGEINKWNITSRYHLSCLQLFESVLTFIFLLLHILFLWSLWFDYTNTFWPPFVVSPKTDMSCVFAPSL